VGIGGVGEPRQPPVTSAFRDAFFWSLGNEFAHFRFETNCPINRCRDHLTRYALVVSREIDIATGTPANLQWDLRVRNTFTTHFAAAAVINLPVRLLNDTHYRH
jgi:hypothetical protein